MISKEQVIAKLDEYKAYSIQQNSTYSSQFTALMEPLYTAVNNYFSTIPDGMIDAITLFIHEAYCDTWNRNAVWEHTFNANRPTDIPEGVADFRKNYYGFDWISTTAATFYAAWVIGTPEGSGDESGGATAAPEPLNNTLVDTWTAEVTAAPEKDLANVIASKDFCASCSNSDILINLWEDSGRLLEYMTTQEIANDVYIERGLLEVIKVKGYSVYVPTYLQGAEIWTDWTQPTLSSNGTWGGDAFAVQASSVLAPQHEVYIAFRNKEVCSEEVWHSTANHPHELRWYNPDPLKISKIQIWNRQGFGQCLYQYEIYACNDGSNWEKVCEGFTDNPVNGQYSTIEVNCNTAYKYWKIKSLSSGGGQYLDYWSCSNVKITAKVQLKVE